MEPAKGLAQSGRNEERWSVKGAVAVGKQRKTHSARRKHIGQTISGRTTQTDGTGLGTDITKEQGHGRDVEKHSVETTDL